MKIRNGNKTAAIDVKNIPKKIDKVTKKLSKAHKRGKNNQTKSFEKSRRNVSRKDKMKIRVKDRKVKTGKSTKKKNGKSNKNKNEKGNTLKSGNLQKEKKGKDKNQKKEKLTCIVDLLTAGSDHRLAGH